MKKEEEFDLYGWKAGQTPYIYEVVCENGDVHELLAHEFIVDTPQPVLKLLLYSKVVLDRIDTIGGAKNQVVERSEEEQTIAELVAAFLPGQWHSIVKVINRAELYNRPPLESVE
jgi:hypothetical protein